MASFKNLIKNMWFLASNPIDNKQSAKSPNSLIAPVQFYRLKQDAASWRSAVTEAENPILPFRVQMQRIFSDTILNGHVYACINKRKNMVVKKGFAIYDGENIDEKATELINKPYFFDLINYVLDAEAFGYNLISFGNLEGDELVGVNIVKRENISPDRLNVAPIVYSPQGVINFMDASQTDKEGISFYDWTAWIPTSTETSQSICGYGYLYKVAIYEIYLRNLLGANADYIEVYGQPLRHAKSNKTEGAEYDKLEAAMANFGSNAWIVTDHETEISFESPKGSGEGYKNYDNFEDRLQKTISKIILGHADALDSTPGKLGSANEAAESALKDTETSSLRFVEYHINKTIIPKLIALGIKIPAGKVFKFKNDHEKEEAIEKENERNKAISDYVLSLSNAGFEVSAEWLTERTGIPVVKKQVPDNTPKFNNKVQNKLNELYGNT